MVSGSNRLAWLITGVAVSVLLNAGLGGALVLSNAERARFSEDIHANAEVAKANTSAIAMVSERLVRVETTTSHLGDTVRDLQHGGGE